MKYPVSGQRGHIIVFANEKGGVGKSTSAFHTCIALCNAGESVAAGREFVRAYVEFVHYVERLHADATSPASHLPGTEAPAPAAGHQH